MVSWSVAFKKAAAYVGFLIVWVIVGSVIIGAGFLVGGLGVKTGPFNIPVPTMANPLVAVVFIVVGYIVIFLGMMATLFKIMAEITAEEVERRLKTSAG
ncbi:MAG: hypothetical protein B9J98_01285 [Candidatus Terraquivivens tikiterensis]|uniref:Uncharacterized protein n=1 Tax=Candidatus Terraquivivens tikiterensis TaxID=1980982 RepID=A0A2R7YAB5_9ARCH|nr:MAG: hypothetical protein B9J98_01285 [Candidatus Terraquivivens tikiterensis]